MGQSDIHNAKQRLDRFADACMTPIRVLCANQRKLRCRYYPFVGDMKRWNVGFHGQVKQNVQVVKQFLPLTAQHQDAIPNAESGYKRTFLRMKSVTCFSLSNVFFLAAALLV